jgi:hypothetical protein
MGTKSRNAQYSVDGTRRRRGTSGVILQAGTPQRAVKRSKKMIQYLSPLPIEGNTIVGDMEHAYI